MQSFAKQRHAFREKSLFGAQPERAPRSRGQKTPAIGFARALLPTDRADVVIRSAIAILAILRADSVAVLRNFPGNPIFVREGGDQIADQLCLPDTASMSANDDN